MSSPRLSGLIVAHNEEEMIEDALRSLSFCDEIVVCLDRCTDDTKEIVLRYTDRILEGGVDQGWDVEGKRRNDGIEFCQGEWIFELDADERATPELGEEVVKTIETAEPGYFIVPVDNYVGDRLVRYGWAGSFGKSAAPQLFKKGCKWWGPQTIHPNLDLKGQKLYLSYRVIHLVDKNIDDMIDRLQWYTSARAKDMAKNGELPKFRKTLRKGFTRFYKSYLSRKGYKEGRMGFLLALMAFLFMVISHIKAEIEMQEEKHGE